MSDPWTPHTIAECLVREFAGEWGAPPKAGGNATVLRSTDIDDNGHVDLSGGARRSILSKKVQEKRLLNGDILLESSGGGPGKPVGRVALFAGPADNTYLTSNFFRALRPNERLVVPAFLAWRLQHFYSRPEIWVLQQQTTGIINLKYRDYLRSTVELPPLPEQRQIAALLDTIDDVIGKTEQIIAKLKEVKQGLLHDLLTCGIDDNGELRDPERHPEQFKESALGQIPREWEVRRLGVLLDRIDAGKSPSCAEHPATGNEWGVLKVSAVRPTGFEPNENKAIVNRAHVEPSFEVQDGDLLITRANTYELVGLTCLVEKPPPRLLLCDKTLRLVVTEGAANAEFVFYASQIPHVRAQIETHATGTSGSMKNIGQTAIRALHLKAPPYEEQVAIAVRLRGIDQRQKQEHREVDKLRLLKAGLMEDLLTGRVRVTKGLETATE